MTGQTQASSLPYTSLRRTVFALIATFVVMAVGTPAAQTQTFSVIHNFTGETDGANPSAGVTVGPSGVLYGTAGAGGTYGNGTVFKLSRVNSSWVFSPLYEFTGGSDGRIPYAGVVIGPNGALYGTTNSGGAGNDGVVFELNPPATFCRSVLCYWNETVLHTFTGFPTDGAAPFSGLAFDRAGDIYGTTAVGGANGPEPGIGTAFELTPSGGGWTESILHNFKDGPDEGGEFPFSGVILDTAGNVYGATLHGGPDDFGGVYQLMPSGGGWVENVLVYFAGTNEFYAYGTLIMDGSGNLYGAASNAGGQFPYPGNSPGNGLVYELARSDGGFTYSVLYAFNSACRPHGGIAMDAAGDLFGACLIGGAYGDGWIFELTSCSQACIVNDLHDFSGSDGSGPLGSPVLDANGNLYGTTAYGGPANCNGGGCGVVWEIAGVGARHKN